MSTEPTLLQLPIISLQGSPRQMGEAFGEQCRESIQKLAAIRLEDALKFSVERAGRHWSEDAVLKQATASLEVAETWDCETHEEFLGIAHGANLSPEKLFIMQGLTDMRDYLAFHPKDEAEGCSSFILQRERAEAGEFLRGRIGIWKHQIWIM